MCDKYQPHKGTNSTRKANMLCVPRESGVMTGDSSYDGSTKPIFHKGLKLQAVPRPAGLRERCLFRDVSLVNGEAGRRVRDRRRRSRSKLILL